MVDRESFQTRKSSGDEQDVWRWHTINSIDLLVREFKQTAWKNPVSDRFAIENLRRLGAKESSFISGARLVLKSVGQVGYCLLRFNDRSGYDISAELTLWAHDELVFEKYLPELICIARRDAVDHKIENLLFYAPGDVHYGPEPLTSKGFKKAGVLHVDEQFSITIWQLRCEQCG